MQIVSLFLHSVFRMYLFIAYCLLLIYVNSIYLPSPLAVDTPYIPLLFGEVQRNFPITLHLIFSPFLIFSFCPHSEFCFPVISLYHPSICIISRIYFLIPVSSMHFSHFYKKELFFRHFSAFILSDVFSIYILLSEFF